MKWPWHRHQACPSPDAVEVLRQAKRLRVDADRRDEAAQHVAERHRQIRAMNHVAEAVVRAIRGV